jgi:DNA-binding response OmpR family regulator
MNRKIYIVEDDEDLQHLLQYSLARAGYQVTIFPTGYPIVAMTDRWPDLFIVDIELPGINGLEVCKWLKSHEESKAIPVIFLSAAPYLKALAEAANGDDYLEKPFELPTLIEKINDCLQSHPVDA